MSASPSLAFVVPAHDEAAQIAAAVEAIDAAARASGRAYEVVVVDDASSDGTGELAAAAGARVVRVEARQIAAARNAGARAVAPSVETLVFVDADTFPSPELVAAALATLERGAVGGGALMRFDRSPWYGHLIVWAVGRFLKLFRMCGGCFLFVRRDAFEAVGGFDESLFVSEELTLAKALRAHGRFVVLARPKVTTSGRKLRDLRFSELARQLWRLARGGGRALRSREDLDVWYGERARGSRR